MSADPRSAEEREADDALLDAITTRLRVYGYIDPDEVVEAFLVAAHIEGMALAERNASRYAFATRDSGYGRDAAPVHALQGLVVRAGAWLAAEDDHG